MPPKIKSESGGSTSTAASTKKATGSSTKKASTSAAASDKYASTNGGSYASTSKSGAAAGSSSSNAPPVRMSTIEIRLHNAILDAPKKTMSQHAIFDLDSMPEDKGETLGILNSLMRKHLLRAAKNAKGEMVFIAVSKADARDLGAMDPEDKLVLDYVTQSANQGIWTRTLKAKTGLHQNVINRAIKVLEQKKLIKNIKSVKYPTRKIYMLESMQPSLDVTGGPWYTGQDLDVDFIVTLQKVAIKYIRDNSFPNGRTDLMYPMAHVPYLPTAQDVLDYMVKMNIMSVELNVEHIEAVLEVLVYDGEIERIWARRYPEDGQQADFKLTDLATTSTKKRKRDGGTSKKKKRRRADSADIDRDSAEEDDNDDSDASTDSDVLRNQMSEDEEYQLPPRLRSRESSSRGDKPEHKRPGPAGNDWYWVYRTCLTADPPGTAPDGPRKNPQIYELGFTQTPCGICPVSEFCYNRGQPKVLPLPGERDLLGLDGGWEAPKGSTAKGKGKAAAEAELLKMKVPSGGGVMEDADGVWKGGGRVGGKVVAPVNPANCRCRILACVG